MNKAQKYLLDNNLSDLVISHPSIKDPKKWVYASDVMIKYKNECPHCENGSVSFDVYDKDLKCWVTRHKKCNSCDGSGIRKQEDFVCK